MRDYCDEKKQTIDGYCVEAECTAHDVTWMCITQDFEQAGKIAHAFPVVTGGLASEKNCFPIPDYCLFAHIPRKGNNESNAATSRS